MLRWYPSVLLRVVLELTYVPIAFATIFALMVLVDRETPWSVESWTGPGASADFWKVVALLALGWTLLVLGWRGAKTLFKGLIVIWHLGLTIVSIRSALDADGFVVRGDAIGFSMSLGILAPVFSLTALACALVWISRDTRSGTRARSVSPLQRRNKLAAGFAGVGLAVSVLAFALDLDEIGTIACFAATFACHETMRPVNPSAELHKALVIEGSAPK